MIKYMKDEEILQFIDDIENNDLVEAPPGIAEKVFERIEKKDKIIEYKIFRNRVIVAVACILVITAAAPKWLKPKPEREGLYFVQNEEGIDLLDSKIFGGLCNTHYISDFMNGREE